MIEWQSDGVQLPAVVERALETGSLVLFCGAGISAAAPSNLPNFRGLVVDIASELGLSNLLPNDPNEPVQFDVVMGELNDVQHDVHARVSARIRSTTTPNSYHSDLLRISAHPDGDSRIITTNFDLLFEAAANEVGIALKTYTAPALPLGNDFTGLVHLHGPVDPLADQRMVVTDADFGQAYITEGWATQFLTRVFAKYVVLFVGYSADDTVMRYLARALPANAETRYAFMHADEADVMTSRWGRLGVVPVIYPPSEVSKHASLTSFIQHWRELLTSTPAARFDRMQSIVSAGPENLVAADHELLWLLNDAEHARHFRSSADPAVWINTVDSLGAIDELFDPIAVAEDQTFEWAQWIARAFDTDYGSAILSAVSRHGGGMSSALWTQVWLRLYEGYEPVAHHRQWLLLLAADQASRESERLSGLLRLVAQKDLTAAEVLLHNMLIPRLGFQPRRGWSFRGDSLKTDLRLSWRDSSVRDAWPTILPNLLDPDHLLTVVLNLIRSVDSTEALFSSNDLGSTLSAQRRTVDGVQTYGRDDPYVLVVDIARDLLREFVRSEGTDRANRLLDSTSLMVQRIALDALAEARSVEADAILETLTTRDLIFNSSTKPEVFRTMKSIYPHATRPGKLDLIQHIQNAEVHANGADISEYQRYNALIWISAEMPPEDPAIQTLLAVQEDHPDFRPQEHPELDWWSVVGSAAPETETDGRFRGQAISDVVVALAADRNLDDPFDGRGTLRELSDFLNHEPGQELLMIDELVEHEFWSGSMWTAVLTSAIRAGQSWSAAPILERIAKRAGNPTDIARGLVFEIARPSSNNNKLENANERCRLLVGLWRAVGTEAGDEPPTDPTQAHSTIRGSLAFAYIETSIRAIQDDGAETLGHEALAVFAELFEAQEANLADPSRMMVARYAGHILALAHDWFDIHLKPALQTISESGQSRSFWAGILTSTWFSWDLMEEIRGALRIGWPVLSRSLPGSTEAFIEIHAAQFAHHTLAQDHAWADPFVASAPESARVRWIRAVARRLDGADSPFDELLFAHWRHRIDGQPPLHGSEERALLDWVTLPGIDLNQAVDLFTQGPVATSTDEDHGFDYYDLDDFPTEDKAALLRVSLHLMRGRTTLPPFLNLVVKVALEATDEMSEVTQDVWNALLSLGYSPARAQLSMPTIEADAPLGTADLA